MATLTGNQIKDTYKSLLKVDDNGELAATLQEITDGNGTGSGVSLNTAGDLKATGTLEFGSLKDTGENITISKFVDAADGIASNNNDTTIPTSAAVKNYVDTNLTAQDLDFAGDTGTGAVDLDSQSLTLTGANGIATTASGQTITIDASSLNTRLTTAEADIDTNTADITAEETARAAADTTLQGNIDSEASTRASADTTLQSNINAEASTRASANTTLQSNIDAEASTRSSADTSLQSQITSNDSDITSLDGRLTTAESNISSNDTDIAALDTRLSTAEGNITSNDTDIATNASNIATNTTDIATNASGISTNATNISTNASDISGLDTRLTTAEGNISSNDSDISTLQSGKQDISEKGQADGYAPLDGTGKIATSYLPSSIIGQVEYQGTWNANTNTPTLPTASTVKGHYYVVSTAGTYLTVSYEIGDWVISNGTDWEKVDNTDSVSSVFGRTGAITALEADYSSYYPLISDLTSETSARTSADSALDSRLTTAETKLATIETNADVTDATNVAAAGALMSGTAVLSDLNDVASTSPSDGQILTYDTVNGWQPETPAQGDTYTIGTSTNGSSVDVNLDAAIGTDSNITLTPSTGLSITQAADVVTITNTAPDQTVSLTASTGISVTGTYPSFTVENTSPDQTVALTGGTNITVSGTYPSFTVDNDITSTDDLTEGSTNLYNQTHTGDVTGSTTLTIANDAVTAAKIIDNIQLDGTESLGIPSGTTAERPSVPAAGMFRYNTTDGKFEGYTTEWGEIGGGELSNIYIDTFTGDGTTVAFTASQSISTENNTQIYIDGVYQAKANYSTSGTTVTFSTAPPNGTAIEMIHVKAIALTTVADNYITNAMLQDDIVSYEKIDDEFTTSDVLTAGASVDVDFDAAQVFTLTPDQNTTLNVTNPKVGITKAIIVTGAGGSYTLAFTVGGASGTFNKISGDYDDTSATKNFIQIVCVSATEFWYSISQIA